MCKWVEETLIGLKVKGFVGKMVGACMCLLQHKEIDCVCSPIYEISISLHHGIITFPYQLCLFILLFQPHRFNCLLTN